METQTRVHKKQLEQGAHVPNQRDLGLMSSGKQGLCRAGIAPAAVGPGGCVCPRRVSAALSPAAAAPLTATITWRSLAPSLYCRGASGSQGDRVAGVLALYQIPCSEDCTRTSAVPRMPEVESLFLKALN